MTRQLKGLKGVTVLIRCYNSRLHAIHVRASATIDDIRNRYAQELKGKTAEVTLAATWGMLQGPARVSELGIEECTIWKPCAP